MANKTFDYLIGWTYKEDGNRGELNWNETRSTTVPRALSKVKKELLDEGEIETQSEVLFVVVRPGKLGPDGLPRDPGYAPTRH